jgi:hypothetical protein
VCIKFRANLGKSANKMIRQAFGEESVSRTGYLNGMLSSGQTEKGGRGEEQSQEHAHHFL